MRLPFLSTFLVPLLFLVSFTTAWTAEDHEIFRLRDEVLASEGPNITFYDFIGASPSATTDDIVKHYRKKSRQLHPDKAIPALVAKLTSQRATEARNKDKAKGKKGGTVTKSPTSGERKQITKDANERYARLAVVAEVLKGPSRERYDHFLRNGFPKWRGTGYYYQRFRPGLGSVLIGLILMFGGAVHYGALYLGWKRHRDFVDRYVRHARKMAWGNEEGIPGIESLNGGASAMAAARDAGIHQPIPPPEAQQPEEAEAAPEPRNRKEKRAMEKDAKKRQKADKSVKERTRRTDKETPPISAPVEAERLEGPQGNKKRVQAENGKVLIVDSIGNVFLEEQTAEGEKHQFLLDPDEIPMPTIYQTAIFRLPVWAYNQTAGRIFNKPEQLEDSLLDGQEVIVENPEDNEQQLISSATAPNVKAETRKRKTKTQQRVDAAVEARNGL